MSSSPPGNAMDYGYSNPFKLHGQTRDGDFEYSLPPVHQIHHERQRREGDSKPEILNEPAVLWAAAIYDAQVTFDLKKPTATYCDDRPMDLIASQTREGTLYDRNPSWEGSVFEVVSRALAYFPENSSKPGTVQVPASIESLKVYAKSGSQILIRSPYLYDKLSEIVGYYPSFHRTRTAIFRPENGVSIYEPYSVLLHHFEQIADLATNVVPQKSNGGDELLCLQIEHIRHLERFLRPIYVDKILPCRIQLEGSPPKISFDMLWYLYKPGTDVYVQRYEYIQTCVIGEIFSSLDNVRDVGAQFTEHEPKYWTLEMWFLNTDGSKIGRSIKVLRIDSYIGFREVTQLDVCPTAIWDAFDKGERRQKIIDRSTLHLKALQQGHLFARYDGPVDVRTRRYTGSIIVDCRRGFLHSKDPLPTLLSYDDYSNAFDEYQDILVKEDGDSNEDVWYVDPEGPRNSRPASPVTALSSTGARWGSRTPSPPLQPSELAIRSPSRRNVKSSVSCKKGLTDHQLLLFYPTTYAFALKLKEWLYIETDYIREISPSEESLNRLILGKDEMNTIRAISQRQNNRHDLWAADFVEGKGTGQIVLLHGPPGVGKTYTVEAIAEWLHRPLLALTVADIGTIETRVERELLKWFTVAEAWNAILLVDEADIFLEKRQNRDLARNGLVSAFLRRMEYFKGLLFLTTNRVGQIDDAFISRVHVALGYKALDGKEKVQIWNGFFQKLANERAGKLQVAPGAKKWVLEQAASNKAQLNGRDIRNALQTAITLAEAEAEEDPDFDSSKMTVVVDQSHFERVLNISNKFHDYVKSIRREDEKKRAAGRFDRNDYWQGEGDQP